MAEVDVAPTFGAELKVRTQLPAPRIPSRARACCDLSAEVGVGAGVDAEVDAKVDAEVRSIRDGSKGTDNPRLVALGWVQTRKCLGVQRHCLAR